MMYRHCIYCSAGLGANEAIEHFPVGRKVAFDAAKGRLWAICATCARWNLAPIEERWEAVEEAERHFVASRMRVHRENIGLARLADGTRLVRIGRALPREMAAWRYGDELRRRERTRLLASRADTVLHLGLLAAALFGSLFVAPAASVWQFLGPAALRGVSDRRAVHRLANADGRGQRVIRRKNLAGAWVKHDGDGLVLALPAASPDRRHLLQLRGDDARRVVERAMVLVNRSAPHPTLLDTAVDALGAAASPDAYIRSVLGQGRVLSPEPSANDVFAQKMGGHVEPTLRGPEALALEMALHEEQERRVLEGELSLLEAAWRDAEEIAAIADTLALPDAKT